MISTANPICIFVPMLVLVALTLVAFIHMAIARAAAVKGGHPAGYYKAHIGAPEPEATAAAVRHYGNLFELPTLFYAACLTAFVLHAVSFWVLVFAWAYVAARLVQSAIHMISNNTTQRAGAFVLGVACVMALWFDLALVVLA